MLEKSKLFFPTLPQSNYKSQSQDTAIQADVYFFSRLRQLTLKQRIEMFISHERGVKKLCLVGIKSRHRNFTIRFIIMLLRFMTKLNH